MERAKVHFIKYLAQYGTVAHACKCAKVSRETMRRHRSIDPEFAEKWLDAVDDAADTLEESLFDRAIDRDTIAAIFLLKGMRPNKYRERQQITTVEEKNIDQAIDAEFKILNDSAEDAEFTTKEGNPRALLPAPGSNGHKNGNGSSTKEEK